MKAATLPSNPYISAMIPIGDGMGIGDDKFYRFTGMYAEIWDNMQVSKTLLCLNLQQ